MVYCSKQKYVYIKGVFIIMEKLFNSELKVLNILWRDGDTPAKQIVKILNKEIGWNRSTTYTIIKRCIDKGIIENKGGNFICHALISKEEAQKHGTTELINTMYDGSADRLVASLLNSGSIKKDELEKLKELINSME
jgi:predicted transcriptional regulator